MDVTNLAVIKNVAIKSFHCTEQSFYNAIFGAKGKDHAVNKLCNNETILQRNYRIMTIPWSFFYNSFVKLHGKKI